MFTNKLKANGEKKKYTQKEKKKYTLYNIFVEKKKIHN